MSDSKKDSTLSMDDLPSGWIQQYDPKSDHPFWVDTKANPPRAIWVHPYEDEQFLNDHPEIRDRHSLPAGKAGKTSNEREGSKKGTPQPAPGEAPPPYSPRRHSFTAEPSHHRRRDEEMESASAGAATSSTKTASKGKGKEKDKGKDKPRSFLGKVKDKAIGTKEEREEARRREMIAQQRYAEQRRQQRRANPYYDDYYGAGTSSRYGPSSSYGSSAFGGSSMGPSPFGPAMYNPPAGNPYVYGQPGYGDRYGYGGRRGYGGGGGFGGGNLALPLLGGLAGGLLLGDIFDGGGLF